MSEIDRLLELRWDNSIEYLEDDSENAKEYQKLKLKCVQSLKLQELVKEEIKKNYKGFADIERLREMVDESENQ